MASISQKNKILKNESNTVQKSFSLLAQPQKSPLPSKKIKKEAQKNRKLGAVTTKSKISPPKKTNNKKFLSSKIAIINTNALSKKAIKIVNNTHVKKNTALALPKNTQVRVLSPFRFPAIRTISISSITRATGVLFVLLGGFFSLVNFQYIGPSSNFAEIHKQSATTIDTMTISGTLSSTTATTPDVKITVESTTVTLTGVVPVSVLVPIAQSVKLISENKHTGLLTVLGDAIKIDETTWRYYWNTALTPDSEYTLRTAIVNIYGNYEYSSSDTYQTINSVIIIPDTTTVASTTSVNNTQISVPNEPTIHFEIHEDSPLEGKVDMSVKVSDAISVSIYAKNKDTLVQYLLGSASNVSENDWRLEWDSKRIPNGTYNFYARPYISGSYFKSSNIARKVINDDGIVRDAEIVSSSTVSVESQIISLSLSKQSPIAGYVELRFSTPIVDYIELYVLPKNGTTPFYIGNAQRISDNIWQFAWNTTQTPNGEYLLYGKAKNIYGFIESNKLPIYILNEVLVDYTSEQEIKVNDFQEINTELIKISDETQTDILNASTSLSTSPSIVYMESIDEFLSVNGNDFMIDDINTIRDILIAYKESLDELNTVYARAIREDNASEIEKLKADIEKLKNDTIVKISSLMKNSEQINKVNSYLSKIAFELLEVTAKNESILKNRLGDAVLTDSDSDGISDYDEVNLYHTNPYSADTDGDGYIDSAEIELGYNPHDSNTEAHIIYESAKDSGIVRDDILYINSITTLSNTNIPEKEIVKEPIALISGKGLPNSFVTLYIYSTPIIITVKTDETGSWSYIFDKEIEDGEHIIYIGVTDNSGKIIAKGNPLSFVKTAEAFTQTNQLDTDSFEKLSPSLVNVNLLLLIGSLGVVALGLILILLGMHVSNRKYPQPLELTHG